MFHIWTLLPALYLLFRFVRPLTISLVLKIIIGLLIAAVCEFHWFTRLLTGNMFSPELSRPLMILVGWLFGVAVFLAGLLLLRDALYLILRILFGQPLTHQSGLRGLLLAVAVILSSVAVWQGIRAPQVNHVRITLKGPASSV
ncbi:hypothetical protein [Candidatus Symbiopectobacterium sp. NZEC135]|uniref:hypothetical protein n=1 Tax=Candidatus Symbiopectobacterium sp. NZEC135 TaxID=2820471 RepID=UPI00222699F2|nr:hypothetical protein [Candidatus Symbiopectobacterium sp. NZEC135]